MDIRPYKNSDYITVCQWWLAHKWPSIPEQMLPSTGFIIKDLCAGFLYKTDSSIALLEFVVSNPKSDKKIRSEALDLLITNLLDKAKSDGFKSVFSSVQHPSLIEKYKKFGFVVGDTNMTNFVRIL